MFSPSWLPLSCQDLVQLIFCPLGTDVCPCTFPVDLEGPLVLGTLEQRRGMPLTRGEATHLLDHVLRRFGMLGEGSPMAAVHLLARVLGSPCDPC